MAAYPQASHEIHKSFPKVAKEGVLRDGPTKHIPAVEECAIEGDAATKDIRPDLPAAGVRYQHGSKLRAAVVAARLYAPKGPPFHIDTDADGDVAGEPIGGWSGQTGATPLEEKVHPLNFNAACAIPEPNADHRGLKIWFALFARQLKECARPVDFRDETFLIHIHRPASRPSTALPNTKNVKAHGQFWLFSQKHSLHGMPARDEGDAGILSALRVELLTRRDRRREPYLGLLRRREGGWKVDFWWNRVVGK
ncbi:hypothetical protein FIBSPDRAFT_927406 [Athelia psychrophila]|uniref:Uncharacterized protein n=1 Tax=Athelia psychrophila TaxID=1759441 RepID=A0A166RST8_9AGAM|nr:hypothetical protein FIBSPDRAFT_927406 [Fibularhizoctonia sp. CBS 109695]